ncbi:MAG TPA: class I SAM-dependent methyltransferase [Longimicrobiaceae bacterium]|nr:class I SAM-dependent methyltransferase [Longimicrobiaceae bacterium]
MSAGPAPAGEMRAYAELAPWWPLFSPPSHYDEEAAHLLSLIREHAGEPPRTLLELGSGGGSMAWHLKRELRLTLSDVSPQMLAVSREANPECEHLLGDMRSLRLGREFDVVLIHDAVMYMTDPASVRQALATAAAHCRPGGLLLVVPDHVKETFAPETSHGGEDGADGSGFRYLEWSWDPDPCDDTYQVAYAFLLRHSDGTVTTEGDRHLEGLFARDAWLGWLREAGFAPQVVTDPWDREVFVAPRPAIPAPGPVRF